MKFAIHRVRSLRPLSGVDSGNERDVFLVKEYLRRVALLSRDVEDWRFGPFFDAKKIGNWELKPEIESEFCKLPTANEQPNGYVRRICSNYIRWQAYADAGYELAKSHIEIYEPLIVLFERGQDLGFHHDVVVVGDYSIPLSNWAELASAPPLEMNPTNRGKSEMVGSQ
jgi:hypothetical protein